MKKKEKITLSITYNAGIENTIEKLQEIGLIISNEKDYKTKQLKYACEIGNKNIIKNLVEHD